MQEANRVKLGAFLLISVSLIVAGFLAVGILRLFAPRHRAMTVLNTSVEGLSVGSPVKYLGMPVGKVTGMTMRESDGCIAVYFDIFPSAVENDDSDSIPGFNSLGKNLSNIMTRRNLMCFINAAGLMGGSYLELAIDDASQPAVPPLDITPPRGVTYIPSRPSHIGNAIQNVSRVLEDLGKVNVLQLADKLNTTLDDINTLLTQSEMSDTLRKLHTISGNLETFTANMNEAVSQENVRRLNQSFAALETGLANLEELTGTKMLADTIGQLNGFLTEARAALRTAEDGGRVFGSNAEILKQRFEMSLTRLDNTLKQLTQLMEQFAADPNQLVRGRREPQVQNP